MAVDEAVTVAHDDQLTEIRSVLSQVRFDGNPPPAFAGASRGIHALFTACFRLVDVVEVQRVELAEVRSRLIKHEMRLRERDAKQMSFAEQSEEGVLDVFK